VPSIKVDPTVIETEPFMNFRTTRVRWPVEFFPHNSERLFTLNSAAEAPSPNPTLSKKQDFPASNINYHDIRYKFRTEQVLVIM
jgi:hypothetical protein